MTFLSGVHYLLSIGTVNCVQTLKALIATTRCPDLHHYYRTVLTVDHKHRFALEDAIGSHACSLEALPYVRHIAFLSGVHFRTGSHRKFRLNTEGVLGVWLHLLRVLTCVVQERCSQCALPCYVLGLEPCRLDW
jgi:hypothetical protein